MSVICGVCVCVGGTLSRTPTPTHLTCQALMDAATEKKEVVMVTDDVLTIKDKFQEEPEGFPVLGAMRKKGKALFWRHFMLCDDTLQHLKNRVDCLAIWPQDELTEWFGVWKCFHRDKAATFHHVSVVVRCWCQPSSADEISSLL